MNYTALVLALVFVAIAICLLRLGLFLCIEPLNTRHVTTWFANNTRTLAKLFRAFSLDYQAFAFADLCP